MATRDSSDPLATSHAAGFRIANGPVIRRGEGDYGTGLDFGELPRAYGAPLLFAMAVDPRTLFTYWSVDWSDVFAQGEPVDRQVYLRVKKPDGGDESQSAIEPMLGSYYAAVVQPRGIYRVEIGYYDSTGVWRSVASSDAVTMPPEGASENIEIDLTTVPFHLSFQRLIDLFRASNGDALAAIISRLQSRTVTEAERALLTPEEWEILRAMDISVSDIDTGRRNFKDRENADLLRKRTEAILGFGSTSPSHAFGDSSWSSSAS